MEREQIERYKEVIAIGIASARRKATLLDDEERAGDYLFILGQMEGAILEFIQDVEGRR